MVTIKRVKAKQRSYFSNSSILVLASIAAVIIFLSSARHDNNSKNLKGGSLEAILDGSKEHLKPHDRHGQDLRNVIPDNINDHDIEEQDSDVDDEESHIAETKHEDEEDEGNGSHAAADHFFADYEYERENPSFREVSVGDWDESHQTILSQMPGLSLRSCQYKSDDHSILNDAKCQDENTKLIAFNSAHFERTWCGIKIPPQKAVAIEKRCDEPVRLFPMDSPPVDGKGMPPIVISSSPNGPSKEVKDVECDISCKFEEKMDGYERYVEGVEWKIIQTMNDPVVDAHAQVERTSFRQDIYYSTTSFQSSVPLTYFSFEKYNIFTPAVAYDEVDVSGSYLLSNRCASQSTKRNRWAGAVEERFKVANYGKCAHNTDTPAGLQLESMEDRIALMKKHRFNLALEFGDAKDHITPIVWEAFSSGTLPVVIGAQNIKNHFPPNSFVSRDGMQHWGDLGDFMAVVATNKTAWEKYHEWRSDPEAKREFESLYNFTRTSPDCRLCRWAYAKRYGCGWSHEQQYVRETAINRQLCIDDSEKLVLKPFRESWHTTASVGEKTDYKDIMTGGKSWSCTKSESTISIAEDDVTVTRTVKFHDNVFDIDFSDFGQQPPDKNYVLRLEFPVRNIEGSYFPNPHTMANTIRGATASSLAIQDSKSKVIVVGSWNTQIVGVEEGIVEVVIRKANEKWPHDKDEKRRIRIIIEDRMALTDKTTEYFPTSFAKLMMKDFIDPLELFYIE